jgi:predicted PurR-regulated permease PerM
MASTGKEPAHNTPSPASRREDAKVLALTAISLLVAYLCYLLLLPFASALTWGITLAVVAHPLHRAIQKRIPNRNAASLIAVLIVALALVVPILFVAKQVVSESGSLVQTVRDPQVQQAWMQKLQQSPRFSQAFNWAQERLNLRGYAEQLASAAASWIPRIFAGSAAGLTQLFIALFSLYFLFRDSRFFIAAIGSLVPLSSAETHDVLSRVGRTIDASIRGRILIAAVQGILGGLMFWWLGLPAPMLWGSAMALMATIPALGAFVVWVPAALFLAISGHPGKAGILTVWGSLVIGTIDNLLYPFLVGKDLPLHTLVIFFSVLGGVAAFGISGLVIGPVVVSIADALIDIWRRRAQSGRDQTEASPPMGSPSQ